MLGLLTGHTCQASANGAPDERRWKLTGTPPASALTCAEPLLCLAGPKDGTLEKRASLFRPISGPTLQAFSHVSPYQRVWTPGVPIRNDAQYPLHVIAVVLRNNQNATLPSGKQKKRLSPCSYWLQCWILADGSLRWRAVFLVSPFLGIFNPRAKVFPLILVA